MLNNNEHIKLVDVNVSYEKFGSRVNALKDLTLGISKGEWVFLVGPNGSGKTTLLKTIAGQITPDSGSITINDVPITEYPLKQLSKKIFYVNQNPMLGSIPQLTVWENLIATDLPGRTGKTAVSCYQKLLKEASLLAHKDHHVQFLSGGQRQILTLMIAKMRGAEILLLDEPMASLDPEKTIIARKIIQDMHQAGTTILYVTHDASLINGNSERFVRLEKGEII